MLISKTKQQKSGNILKYIGCYNNRIRRIEMIKEDYLAEKSKEELTELVDKLLNKLSDRSRLEFISRWISPQAALNDACEGDSNNFLIDLEKFCEDCLNGEYYIEPDYDNYCYHWYEDPEDYIDYSDSKWAEEFQHFYTLAIMFSRNNEFEVSLKAFDVLFDCLQTCEIDQELLGTQDPMAYIDINWDIAFSEYFRNIASHYTDKRHSAIKAIEVWANCGSQYSDIIFKYFTDLDLIEEAIRHNIKKYSDHWPMQNKLYELLKNYYVQQDKDFDEIEILESMLCYSKNFTVDLAQGYISLQKWTAAVIVILPVLNVIDDNRIIESLNVSLLECYDKLKQYDKGLEVATSLFKNHAYNHDYYLKARDLANKVGKLDSFINEMIAFAKTWEGYYPSTSTEILLRIFSSEGYVKEMIDLALKTDARSRYDCLKFTYKSLLFRVLRDKNIDSISEDLGTLILRLKNSETPGIVDMVDASHNFENEDLLLQRAIDILKEIIQFHIDAAKRTRYVTAAYYCSLLQGIYKYMNEEDKFLDYYRAIMAENPKRRALKDEMRKIFNFGEGKNGFI